MKERQTSASLDDLGTGRTRGETEEVLIL